jgi:hypothetical protein
MIFVGVDWAEAHHDICVLDEAGDVLGRKKIPDSLIGVRELHELLAPHAEEPDEVIVGIETDRGLIVTAMLGANYHVYALNPMSVARYRERHVTSGSKSDPGDAKVLADVVRTDRHNHREMAGDSEGADAIKVLARAHQSAIWSRQREKNALRNGLKDYYPGALDAFGTELDDGDAVEVLAVAPTPTLGAALAGQDHIGPSSWGSPAQPRAHREEDPGPCAKSSCTSVRESKRRSARSPAPTSP